MVAKVMELRRNPPRPVAVYADGCRVTLHPRGDADTECPCARKAPLLGLVERAA